MGILNRWLPHRWLHNESLIFKEILHRIGAKKVRQPLVQFVQIELVTHVVIGVSARQTISLQRQVHPHPINA